MFSPFGLYQAPARATVVGLPQNQIGRRDDFFGLGGTSLSAVNLAVTLNRLSDNEYAAS